MYIHGRINSLEEPANRLLADKLSTEECTIVQLWIERMLMEAHENGKNNINKIPVVGLVFNME